MLERNGMLQTDCSAVDNASTVTNIYALLVLIVGMKAGASNMSLSRCCGVALYPSGFVKPLDQFAGNVRSGSERIFYAGTVTAPKNIGESLNEATAAADAAARYLGA